VPWRSTWRGRGKTGNQAGILLSGCVDHDVHIGKRSRSALLARSRRSITRSALGGSRAADSATSPVVCSCAKIRAPTAPYPPSTRTFTGRAPAQVNPHGIAQAGFIWRARGGRIRRDSRASRSRWRQKSAKCLVLASARSPGFLRIFDIKDPAQPVQVGSFATPNTNPDVATTGTFCVHNQRCAATLSTPPEAGSLRGYGSLRARLRRPRR